MTRKWIKYLLYLVVVASFSASRAGSYEDFFKAIRQDDVEVVQGLLARGFDPNVPSPDQQSGLFLAVREPSPKVAGVLISWPRTNVNALNAQGESPLMMAALRGHLELAEKLVARDADVNKTGWAPLHYASTNGHVAIMRLLLAHHAYIDAESPNGTTPLMMAAKYGTSAAVKLLLEEGADPILKNQLGFTELDFAHQGERPDAVALITAFIRGRQPKGQW